MGQLPEVPGAHLKQIPGLIEPVSNRSSCIQRECFYSLIFARETISSTPYTVCSEQTSVIHKVKLFCRLHSHWVKTKVIYLIILWKNLYMIFMNAMEPLKSRRKNIKLASMKVDLLIFSSCRNVFYGVQNNVISEVGKLT